jgi:hypothetical protein
MPGPSSSTQATTASVRLSVTTRIPGDDRVGPALGHHPDRAPLVDGLGGVDDEVEEDLLQALGDAGEQRQGSESRLDPGAVGQLGPGDPQHLLEEPVEVGGFPGLAGVRELAHVANDRGGTFHPLVSLAQELAAFGEHLGELPR